MKQGMDEPIRLILNQPLLDLNEYIRIERGNKFGASAQKKILTNYVATECIVQRIPKFKRSVYITYHWYCENKKKDKDNIEFAKKFILDGMVVAKVIKNDGWKDIEGSSSEWYIDSTNPRVEVEIH